MLLLIIFWVVLATIDPVLGVLIVGVVGQVGAYLVAAHKMSGKNAATEAAQLWEESKNIRDWSAARIDKCDQEIIRLTAELDAARAEIRRLTQLLDKREGRGEY